MSGPHQHPGEWRGGDWQPPSEQTQHGTFRPTSGPPSGPISGPPGYPQPVYGQPYGQPQQPPPYGRPPGPPPVPGRPGFPPPPPPPRKNNQTWLIGGLVIGVVVVLLLVLGILVLNSAMGDDVKYQATDDLCETFKPDSFDDFDLELSSDTEPRSKQVTRGKVQERECDVTYQGAGDSRGYASLTAKAEVSPTASRTKSDYETWARYEFRTEQPGREVREVTGYGQGAALVVTRSRSSLTLELHSYDDNLELSLRFYSGEPEELNSRDVDKLQQQLMGVGREIMTKLQVPAG